MNNLTESFAENGFTKCLLLFLALVLVSGCSGTLNSTNKLEARKHYEEALNAQKVKDNDSYISQIKLAIEDDPKEPFYRYSLGNAYFRAGKMKDAEQEYLASIKMGLPYSDGHRQLGRLYLHMQKWDDAIFHLQKVIETPNLINPHQVYNWLAVGYYAKNDLNNAEKVWLKALRIKENGQIRLNLGNIYMQAERFDLAKESYLKAVEQNDKLVSAHFELGQLFLKDRKFNDARNHFEKVITIEPLSESAKASKEYLKLIPK